MGKSLGELLASSRFSRVFPRLRENGSQLGGTLKMTVTLNIVVPLSMVESLNFEF